jgi:hypothetical protein
MRTHRAGLLTLVSLLIVALTPDPALAQGSGAAIPVQGLRFGTLIPGVPAAVSSVDGAGRAAIEVSGRGQITATFTLPAGLRTTGGELLPILFGATDGRIVNASNGNVEIFDPRAEHRFSIGGSQNRATIYLGGTALPAANQTAGEYEGEITLRVTVTSGNT